MVCEDPPCSQLNATPCCRWYLTLFTFVFVTGVISIEIWPTEMPVWAFVVALLIGESLGRLRDRWVDMLMFVCPSAFGYVIPCGMIQAITNQQIGLKCAT